MLVFNSGDFSQKKGEVRMLRKPRELPTAILANVDDLLDPGVRKKGEKLLGGLCSESDGADKPLHKCSQILGNFW